MKKTKRERIKEEEKIYNQNRQAGDWTYKRMKGELDKLQARYIRLHPGKCLWCSNKTKKGFAYCSKQCKSESQPGIME